MKKKEKTGKLITGYRALIAQVKQNKVAFAVFVILRALMILQLVISIYEQNWQNCFVCGLALVMLLIPPFVEKSFRLRLPTVLEVILFCFVFCAQILGEINSYYIKYAFWDTALHTTSGFIFAAVGFCLVDLLNENKRIKFSLSPVFVAVVAFCFSMTIGVLWEFFEFGADQILHTDMQKDRFVQNVYTVELDETKQNEVVPVEGVEKIVLHLESGQTVQMPGHLDIGIIDTMEDLFVNFAGAVVFCILGYFYVKYRGRGRGRFARHFIPVVEDESE